MLDGSSGAAARFRRELGAKHEQGMEQFVTIAHVTNKGGFLGKDGEERHEGSVSEKQFVQATWEVTRAGAVKDRGADSDVGREEHDALARELFQEWDTDKKVRRARPAARLAPGHTPPLLFDRRTSVCWG